MELARAEDPERTALRETLEAWADTVGLGWKYRVTLQELMALVGETKAGATGYSPEPRWSTLYSAVQAVAGGRRGADAQSLGRWAQRYKDRVVGDVRLVNKPNPKGASKWWVEHTKGTEKPGKRDETEKL